MKSNEEIEDALIGLDKMKRLEEENKKLREALVQIKDFEMWRCSCPGSHFQFIASNALRA